MQIKCEYAGCYVELRLLYVGVAIGTPTIGWLSGYWNFPRQIMFIGTSVALCLSIIIIYYTPSPKLTALCMLLLGFSLGVYLLAYTSAKECVNKENYGLTIGLINTLCSGIGAPILQPIIGALLLWCSSGIYVNGTALYSVYDYQTALVVIPCTLALALIGLIRQQSLAIRLNLLNFTV